MSWIYLVRLALRSILRNRMRSLLTILGIVIGVGAVIALLSVGRGTQAAIQGQIASLGTNMIMVRSGSVSSRGVSMGASSLNTLSLDDVEKLGGSPGLISAVSPVITAQGQAVHGSSNWLTTVQGVDPSYIGIKNLELSSGRFFTDRDVDIKSKVAVLGPTVAGKLFGAEDPVGGKIRVGAVPFTVIGLLESKGDSMGGDQDDMILAPSTTVLYRLGDGRTIRQIVASAASEDVMEEAQAEIKRILRKQHGLAAAAEDDFSIRSQNEITEAATSVTDTLIALLSAIAAVSLIVGGIGIMNIMLVSVTERTREIGIRLAVGARARDVMAQFLVESVILCLIGGLVGIVAGVGTGQILSGLMKVDPVVDPSTVLVAALFSGVVGVFFGWYPARKASRMDPVEALRHE